MKIVDFVDESINKLLPLDAVHIKDRVYIVSDDYVLGFPQEELCVANYLHLVDGDVIQCSHCLHTWIKDDDGNWAMEEDEEVEEDAAPLEPESDGYQ